MSQVPRVKAVGTAVVIRVRGEAAAEGGIPRGSSATRTGVSLDAATVTMIRPHPPPGTRLDRPPLENLRNIPNFSQGSRVLTPLARQVRPRVVGRRSTLPPITTR